MSSENTAVYVHESRFPLRILKHLVKAGPPGVGSQVHRLDALFRYEANARDSAPSASTSYKQASNNDGVKPSLPRPGTNSEKGKGKQSAQISATETSRKHDGESQTRSNTISEADHIKEILTFESPIEGVVTQWCAPEGQLLRDPYQPVLRILEPCKHPVQLGGLCAICGKDLTSIDYTGFRETSRASISMAHDTANLTVSLEEAARLEQQTTSRLRREEKLSLIVDLDQTIIHATVDPTVGEWMFDEKNPNYPVLRDVQRFKLLNEDGKEEGCWYYVKPRPTLKHFLEEASKLYELHVYTMGTRQYAENVCRIIDPDGRMFANRILSRDESGSLVRKSLERLFPVDQSMVVIIDDRADIWDWSPHLVKVVPYDFFVGIGDINSAFLPKQRSALATPPKDTTNISHASIAEVNAPEAEPSPAIADESAAISEQNETLDHQILDKPLARMQEEKSAALHEALDHAKSDSSTSNVTQSLNLPTNGTRSTESPKSAPSPSQRRPDHHSLDGMAKASSTAKDEDVVSDSSDSNSENDSSGDSDDGTKVVQRPQLLTLTAVGGKQSDSPPADTVGAEASLYSAPASVISEALSIPPEEEAVLHDDDSELERVLELLGEIHRRFYGAADAHDEGVESIIPRMKSEVLKGCNIVFSGVIPLDRTPEASEIWQLAEQFGATCTQDLSRRTTHVIAARKGTLKVNNAQRRRDISIVSLSWLLTSVNLWRRQPESAYALDSGSPQDSDAASSKFGDKPSPQAGSGNVEQNEDDDETDLHEIDWGDAEAEIQAFLDETDDEDSRLDSSHEDVDGNASEDDGNNRSLEGGKRPLTSSTTPQSGPGGAVGSPLAKRRRVAAARAGQSKLKLSESAPTVEEGADGTADEGEDDDLNDFAKALEGELM